MKHFLLLLILVGSVELSVEELFEHKTTFENCGPIGVPVKVMNGSFSLQPNPLIIGHSYIVKGNLQTDEEITGGNVTVQGLWLPSRNSTEPVPLVTATLDLCDLLVDLIGKSCPITKGRHQGFFKNTVLEAFPKGLYNITVTAHNLKNKLLFCMKLQVEFTYGH